MRRRHTQRPDVFVVRDRAQAMVLSACPNALERRTFGSSIAYRVTIVRAGRIRPCSTRDAAAQSRRPTSNPQLGRRRSDHDQSCSSTERIGHRNISLFNVVRTWTYVHRNAPPSIVERGQLPSSSTAENRIAEDEFAVIRSVPLRYRPTLGACCPRQRRQLDMERRRGNRPLGIMAQSSPKGSSRQRCDLYRTYDRDRFIVALARRGRPNTAESSSGVRRVSQAHGVR